VVAEGFACWSGRRSKPVLALLDEVSPEA
jgi:hypothetical protein